MPRDRFADRLGLDPDDVRRYQGLGRPEEPDRPAEGGDVARLVEAAADVYDLPPEAIEDARHELTSDRIVPDDEALAIRLGVDPRRVTEAQGLRTERIGRDHPELADEVLDTIATEHGVDAGHLREAVALVGERAGETRDPLAQRLGLDAADVRRRQGLHDAGTISTVPADRMALRDARASRSRSAADDREAEGDAILARMRAEAAERRAA